MNGNDFIQIAGRFVTIGEAGSRSATSRAYYGALHVALEIFEQLGCEMPKHGKAHNLVPICLGKSNFADAKRAGWVLNDLHSKRIRADYKLDDAEIGQTAAGRLSVESASEVARLLETFLNQCHTDVSLRDEFLEEVRRTINRIAP